MMYINTESNEYPLTQEQVKAAFPNVSFAEPFDPPAPYAWVEPSDQVEYDSMTQRLEDTAELVNGVYVQTWNILPLTEEESGPLLAARRLELLREIDADANAIYRDATGDRQAEYTESEAQAQAFKDAGYTGEAGAMVSAWATASGNTDEVAADDILAQAAQWRQAQAVIRAQRLAHKQAIREANTSSALVDAKTSWGVFVSTLRADLGGALTP